MFFWVVFEFVLLDIFLGLRLFFLERSFEDRWFYASIEVSVGGVC